MFVETSHTRLIVSERLLPQCSSPPPIGSPYRAHGKRLRTTAKFSAV